MVGRRPSEAEGAKVLISRATYGARPRELERVSEQGTRAWLEQQLHPERIDDSATLRLLSPLTDIQLSTSELLEKYPRPSRRQKERRERRKRPRRVLLELSQAKLLRAVYSERQLQEVMTDFWFNHFNVYARKNRETLLSLPSYERDAIRPNAFGKFEDLLLSTARHPAMLLYLDNRANTREGFDPREALRGVMASDDAAPRRRFGINENYAREILELHTLGVDGGYTENDVREVARALTGWSVVGERVERLRRRLSGRVGAGELPERGSFFFNALAHDEGPKTILGKRIDAGGMEDGLAVIRMLSAHPSTARFVSLKLARRFVGDAPSDAVVEEMTHTFVRSGGDIRDVLRTMFLSPRFYEEAAGSPKVKTPLELVASALRATSAEVKGPSLVRTLAELGMPVYLCQPPTGYDEESSAWLSAGSVLGRSRFALDLAAGRLRGVRLPDPPEEIESWASELSPSGGVHPAVARPGGGGRAEADRIALVLASPAFQRH